MQKGNIKKVLRNVGDPSPWSPPNNPNQKKPTLFRKVAAALCSCPEEPAGGEGYRERDMGGGWLNDRSVNRSEI